MTEALSEQQRGGIYLASGFVHPELAADISDVMGVPLGDVVHRRHPNGEFYERFGESVRGKHVILVQPEVATAEGSPQDAHMQLCLLIDAARSSSAAEITAVCPVLAYMRSDRKSHGREATGIRVVIDQLAAAGVSRIVTVDMHAPASQALFRGPFDHLTAQPLLRGAMRQVLTGYDRDQCLVVAPDAGAAKLADRHAKELGMTLLHLTKTRDPDDSQKVLRNNAKVPEADGRVCMIFDDMIDTAGTLAGAAENLNDSGAEAIYVAATHGVFSGPAAERLRDSPIDKIFVTNTYPSSAVHDALGERLVVVDTAQMIGHALIEIISGGSVSEIFRDQNHM